MKSITSKFLLIGLLLLSSSLLYAQINKVAIVSVYGLREINADDFGGLTKTMSTLSQDGNFQIDSLVTDFYTKLYTEFAQSFPFSIMPEEEVLSNPQYATILDNTAEQFKFQDYQVTTPEDRPYKPIMSFGLVVNNKAIESALAAFPEADGVMIAYISYSLVKESEIMGFGTAKIRAYINLKLHDRNNKVVLKLKEGAKSDKQIRFALGGSVFEAKEMQALCKEATANLLKDMEKELPKSLAKMAKKLK